MTWVESKDLMLLRVVAAEGVFMHKFGSRERGKIWQAVASELNTYPGFNVTARSVRDRYTVLSRKHKTKNSQEQRESGGGGDKEPTEIEHILEDLIEISDVTDKRCEEESEKKKELNEQEKNKAIDMRDKAMERFGQTRKRIAADQDAGASDSKTEKVKRRSASDTLEWLREKGIEDKKLKEEQAKQKREELDLLRTNQDNIAQQLILQQQGQQDQMKMLQNQMGLQMQQQQQQQQQFLMMQQQMLAAMQQLSNAQKRD